jgi:hypothetical protein
VAKEIALLEGGAIFWFKKRYDAVMMTKIYDCRTIFVLFMNNQINGVQYDKRRPQPDYWIHLEHC